jgi:hypothetical protein
LLNLYRKPVLYILIAKKAERGGEKYKDLNVPCSGNG